MLGDTNSSPRPGAKLERSLLVRGSKWDVERVRVQFPGRGAVQREVIRHPGAVIILPLLEPDPTEGRSLDAARGDGVGPRVVLIRNWRLSIEDWLYELPAGTMTPGEDPAACAARELEEETGYAAATLEPLTRFYSAPGLTDEVMHAFVARGLRPVGQRPEADELLTVHPVPPSQALQMISGGSLVDAKSMLTLLLAESRGLFGNPARA